MEKKIFEPMYPAELYTSRPNETALLSPIYDYSTRAEIMISRLLTNNARKRRKGQRNWIAPKVYQISILNFHYSESDNETMTWYTLQSDSGKKLSNRQNVIFIDLATIREKLGTPVEKLTPIERWGLFFSYVDDENQKEYIGEILKKEEGIMAAEKIVKAMSKANSNWYAQNSRYIAECDANTNLYYAHQKGFDEGLSAGTQQKAVEAAIISVKEFHAIPEDAAKKMGAPLELVLEGLQK